MCKTCPVCGLEWAEPFKYYRKGIVCECTHITYINRVEQLKNNACYDDCYGCSMKKEEMHKLEERNKKLESELSEIKSQFLRNELTDKDFDDII